MNALEQGETLFSEGRVSEAEKVFLELLETDPANAQALNDMGVLSHGRGDTTLAIRYFEEALSNGNYPDALLNLAEVYKAGNRLDQVIACYERYLQIDDRNEDLYMRLAALYSESGRMEEAKRILSRRDAIRARPAEDRCSYREVQILGSSHSRGTVWGERFRRHAVQALQLLEGSILDVGSNDGYAMEVFRAAGRPVWGIDIHPIRVLEALSRGLRVLCLDVNDLALISGVLRVDSIFCSHTLEHTVDPERVLGELGTMAKKHMYIVVPKEQERPEENPSHYSVFPNPGALEKIVPHGWEILRLWEQQDIEPEIAAFVIKTSDTPPEEA
jgi:tetratricopeptide (TPR) repeat protein